MKKYAPRIRIYTEHGQILIRDGLDLCFYMRRSHHEVAQAVMRSLETYLRAIGPRTLAWYVDPDGDWQELDPHGWPRIRHELLENRWPIIELKDTPGGEQAFRFEYQGKWFEDPRKLPYPDMVSAASFWLPTEFLEEHGPEHVQALALELAACLMERARLSPLAPGLRRVIWKQATCCPRTGNWHACWSPGSTSPPPLPMTGAQISGSAGAAATWTEPPRGLRSA